jgi:hypothetical protein
MAYEDVEISGPDGFALVNQRLGSWDFLVPACRPTLTTR